MNTSYFSCKMRHTEYILSTCTSLSYSYAKREKRKALKWYSNRVYCFIFPPIFPREQIYRLSTKPYNNTIVGSHQRRYKGVVAGALGPGAKGQGRE